MTLYKQLKNYSKKHIVAMHMPGHKRHNIFHSSIPYCLDITEIHNFDNLHNANSLLKDCQEKLSKLYSTKQSYYLVNGSTSGILSSVATCCNINDKIITTTSCHKSVYHIIELLNLKTAFIPIETDENNILKSISPKQVEKIIENNRDAKCVLITSPTYEGVISDIKSIANICHKYNIPLIVDEAHGSHLFITNESAINNGADLVINSLHKTLPSLTQTAAIHLNGNLIDKNKLQHNISVFMTSSPSYILMASIDECVNFLIKNKQKYIKKLQNNLKYFFNLCKNLKYLKILNNNSKKYFNYDNSKIIILTNYSNINGNELMQKLREQKIELEMCQNNYALAYSTILDNKNDFKKLFKALKKIDNTLKNQNNLLPNYNFDCKQKLNIHEAKLKPNTTCELQNSVNQVCAEYVWTYPPGIPILLPGQIISKQIIDYILKCNECNLDINSTFNDAPSKIHIIKLDKI